MANDNDTTRRPRPFAPPAPPFPGPGSPPRAPASPPGGGGAARPAPFVGSRPVNPATAAPPAVQPQPPAVEVPAPRAPLPAASPASHATAPVPSVNAPLAVGEEPAPEEAAQALSGLPYIDDTGAAHEPNEPVPAVRLSGKMHRVEHDVPGVLEAIAARIRGGTLLVPNVDPFGSDAAVLAAVLAAMLRNRDG